MKALSPTELPIDLPVEASAEDARGTPLLGELSFEIALVVLGCLSCAFVANLLVSVGIVS